MIPSIDNQSLLFSYTAFNSTLVWMVTNSDVISDQYI